MQKIISTSKYYILSFFLAFSVFIIFIHKVDSLTNLRLFNSLKIFYLLFFGLLGMSIYTLLRKKITLQKFLLITLPSQIIIFFGIHLTENLHYFFNLLVGAWLILLGLFTIQKILNNKNFKNLSISTEQKFLTTSQKNKKAKIFTKINISFLFLIIICQLFFSFYHLNKALYVDEKLWTYSHEKRIETYWDNIREQDWKNTRPSDKPGITLAMISGIGLLWTTPSDFINIEENDYSKEKFLQMLFIMRIPIIILISCSLLIFYYFIAQLFTPKISLLATAFISLSPILIGIGRVINPDALSWILIPLTLLSYFIYNKNQKNNYLFITGVLLGLSLLTKYIANFLIIFFLVEIFIQPILFNLNEKKIPLYLKKKLLDFSIIVILALITFYIFYPGVWVKLDRLLIGTIWSQAFLPIWKYFIAFIILIIIDKLFFNFKFFSWIIVQLQKIRKFLLIVLPLIFSISFFLVFLNVYAEMSLIDFEHFLASPKTTGDENPFGIFLAGIYTLTFGLTVFSLLGIFLALFFALKNFWKSFCRSEIDSSLRNSCAFSKSKKVKLTINLDNHNEPLSLQNQKSESEIRNLSFQNYLIWQILFFILIFYLASIFSEVVPMLRYQIVIFPLILIISAIGYLTLFNSINFSKLLKFLNSKNNQNQNEFITQIQKFIFPIFLSIIILTNCIILWSIKPHYFSYNNFLLPQEYIINPKDIGDGNYEIAQYLNELPDAKNLLIWSDKNGICNLFIGQCFSVEHPEDFELHGPDYDYFVISKGRKSKLTRLTEQRLNGNPDYSLRLDKLYQTKKILHEITTGNRQENYLRVIKAEDIKIWYGF